MSGIKIDLDNRPQPKPTTFLDNRTRALKRMKAAGAKGAVLIFGRADLARAISDYEAPFRQDSCFYWLSGVNEPNCVYYIDTETAHSVLFYPDLPEDLAIWTGPLPTLEELKEKYQTDEVLLTTQLVDYLKEKKPETIYTLEETYNEKIMKEVSIPLNFKIALEAIGEERQIKNEGELELMRYACNVNCDAFYHTIKSTKVGMYAQQNEAMLQPEYIDGYCRENAFSTIVCVGKICATLHYHENSK